MLKCQIIFLLALIVVSSCKKEEYNRIKPVIAPRDTIQIPTTQNPAPPADTINPTAKYYLALGHSYTIGQSVPENERFPIQTVEKLKTLSVLFNQPEIIAQTGWTTGNLINTLSVSAPARNKYDIVSLLIGVNNQYQ